MLKFLSGDADEVFDDVYRALQIYPDCIKDEIGIIKWHKIAILLMSYLDDNNNDFYMWLKKKISENVIKTAPHSNIN